MHYDDGFDLIAPPMPDVGMDVATNHPPKLVDTHEHDLWWVFPLALLVSAVVSGGLIWLLIQALK